MYDTYTESTEKGQQGSMKKKSAQSAGSELSEPGMRPLYHTRVSEEPFRKRAYHKRYVEDISNERTDSRKIPQRVRSNHAAEKIKENRRPALEEKKYETRRIFDIKYKVPVFDISNEEKHTFAGACVLALTRTLVLERLDTLIVIQDRENRWYEWKRLRG